MNPNNVVSDSLKNALSAASTYSEWSAAIVLVGVCVEFLVWLFYSNRKEKSAEKIWLFIGYFLVILGVGGEFIFSGRITRLAEEIQQVSDQKVASVQKDAGEANNKAADALKQAAILGLSQKNLHNFVAEQKNLNDAAIGELNKSAASLSAARDDARASADITKKDLAEMTDLLNQESALRKRMISLMAPRHLSANNNLP